MSTHPDTLTTAGARRRVADIEMSWEPLAFGLWIGCKAGNANRPSAWVRPLLNGQWRGLTRDASGTLASEANAKAWCEAQLRTHIAQMLS